MNLSWNERRKLRRYIKQTEKDAAKSAREQERERQREEKAVAKQWEQYYKFVRLPSHPAPPSVLLPST